MTKNRLNDIDGKTWLKYSFSIWRDIRKTPGEIKLKHPAMFPTALTTRIIEIFTKKDAVIFDPFMGCGSSIISAVLNNRLGIGFDLSKEYVEITKNRINNLKLDLFKQDIIEPKIYNEDARNILQYINPEMIDLCITSPPYWDILNRPRSADRKKIVNYGNSNKNLGNITDYHKFLIELKDIFKKIHAILKPNGYCVIVVMDIRKKNKFYPLHSDLTMKLEDIGYTFEDIIIWDRQHEYNNMRPLGYPYAFRVNKVHEYIIIFKKVNL